MIQSDAPRQSRADISTNDFEKDADVRTSGNTDCYRHYPGHSICSENNEQTPCTPSLERRQDFRKNANCPSSLADLSGTGGGLFSTLAHGSGSVLLCRRRTGYHRMAVFLGSVRI